MKLTVDNLGKIVQSEIELNNLTILVGDNNSGKTYITYSIYGMLKNWTDFINYNSFKDLEARLKIEGQISLNKEEIQDIVSKSIVTESSNFQKRIRDLFNDKEKIFAEARVKLEFEKPTEFKDCEKKIQIGENIVFDGKLETMSKSLGAIPFCTSSLMKSLTISFSKSFSKRILNNLTVANASPLARCLSAIGIPSARTNFPKLCEGCSGNNFCERATVQSVLASKS